MVTVYSCVGLQASFIMVRVRRVRLGSGLRGEGLRLGLRVRG